MMKRYSVLFLALLLTAGAASAQQSGSGGSSDNQSQPQDSAEKPQREDMNSLTAQVFQMAFQAISEGGHFYPFAAYLNDGQLQSFTFNMKGKEEPPPEDKWVRHLFSKMRTKVKTTANLNTAAIAKLHTVQGKQKTADGEKKKDIPGVWVLVDHRDANPVVAYMPLVPGEDGKHEPGDMVYSGTDNWIFPSSKSNRGG